MGVKAEKLVIVLNGESQIEYDRGQPLPGIQRRYLDAMDGKMSERVVLDDKEIKNPDLGQQAQFVAMHLVHSLFRDDDARVAAATSWLATRLPDLKQVRVDEQGENMHLELVFSEAYRNQVEVKLELPAKKKKTLFP